MLRLLACAAFLVLASGCTQTAPPVAAVVAAAPAPTPVTVAADGSLALGDCGTTPVGQACVLNVGDPSKGGKSGNIVHVPIADAQGHVSSLSGTLTWTSMSPTNDQLGLRIVLLSCSSASCKTDTVVKETSGPSPLSIDASDLDVPDGLTLGFTVLRGPSPAGHSVSTFQDFHIEGTANVDAAPAPASS